MSAVYSLKRIAAYAIDFLLVYTPLSLLLTYGQSLLFERIAPPLRGFLGIAGFGFSILLPVVCVGTLVGLTGRSPGKLLMFLKVTDGGEVPGLAQGVLRELLKILSLSFFLLGAIWALQGLVTRGETFYDQWLDLKVEDLRPYGLSETQRNWRKYHRQQAKLKR